MFQVIAIFYGPIKFIMVMGKIPNLMLASDLLMVGKYSLTFMSLSVLIFPVRAVLTILTTKWIIRNPWFLEKIGNRLKKIRTRTLKNYEQVEYGTSGPESTSNLLENIIITDKLEAYKVICHKDGSKTF